MTPDFATIHGELRSVARGILGKLDPRRAGGQAPGLADWQLLADSGWLGLEVPEAADGAGATFAEVAVILHEMGRAAILSSYLGSTVLGVGALNLVEAGQARDDLLRLLASGAQKAALVAPTADEAAAPEDATASTVGVFRLEPVGGDLRLFGQAQFVPDAIEAKTLLVIARHPHSGLVLVPVDRETASVHARRQPVLDATRRLGVVTADGVEVSEESVWRFDGDSGPSLRKLFDRGALATACDSLGLAEAMMEATVAYAGVRKQFDRPIGSFQAVKHACADMLVQVMIGRELLSDAVQAVVADDPEAPVSVSMAKSYVCSAAVDVVGKAMQLHGGIGYTWESGIHVYLKRAVLNRSLFGSPSAHRRRLARRYN